MKATVTQFGKDPVLVTDLPEGSTVRDALQGASVSKPDGASVSVDGSDAAMNTVINDGARIHVVGKVKGG